MKKTHDGIIVHDIISRIINDVAILPFVTHENEGYVCKVVSFFQSLLILQTILYSLFKGKLFDC